MSAPKRERGSRAVDTTGADVDVSRRRLHSVEGRVDAPAVGVWMRCADAPASYRHLRAGEYTVITFDGVGFELVGTPGGFVVGHVTLAEGERASLELALR